MTTEDALLAAVLANPDDDLPRLVFADWLEEHGQPERAEFIRVQIDLAVANSQHGNPLSPEDHKAAIDWLENRQMKLLWGDHQSGGSNWEWWCWAAARDEDGTPIRGDGRGGTVVTPHGSSGLGGNPASCATPTPNGGLVYQEWSRGFVEVIRCKLADWCGGECPTCRYWATDGGGSPTWAGQFACPYCHGTGRTGGHGPAIVRRHPVSRVELTDREPADRTEVNERWYWFRDGMNALGDWQDGSHLPDFVFDSLHGSKTDTIGLPYLSRESALGSLSAALIAWAKSQPTPVPLPV